MRPEVTTFIARVVPELAELLDIPWPQIVQSQAEKPSILSDK
jgi:hypothetical protein